MAQNGKEIGMVNWEFEKEMSTPYLCSSALLRAC
jgi:hypothetical protein